MKLPENYLSKLYAAWMGKIIGIRLGAPIEGWPYEKIKNVYGELTSYPIDYKDFAADDDSNGPLFFVRALEDCKDIENFSADDVAQALLNYASYEKGFFWWGGYGISTEHTAYLNLRNGIKAPQSGSIDQNGYTMAEQIGGQIFIDCWGLVAPGNPDLAAKLAEKAASVTHGGEGIYGGIFVATAISLAFIETDIKTVINKALSYIPKDCEYARVSRDVMDYYEKNPKNWRDGFKFVFDNYGYDKYEGNCHIIPNAAVMILSMLYGEGDFENTLNICNMCGWDTDCNVGNVGTIMGALCGMEGIDYDKWMKPINDFVAASSVIGSLNIQDVSQGAGYFAKMAYKLAGIPMDEEMKRNFSGNKSHFEFEGSTHSIRVRGTDNYAIRNTDEEAFEGNRSLKISLNSCFNGEEKFVYKKTYYKPSDFYDSRYDPSFSPIVYPGQTVKMAVMPALYEDEMQISVVPYVKLGRTGEIIRGKREDLSEKKWYELMLEIPFSDDYVEEMGFIICGKSGGFDTTSLTVYLDSLEVLGEADYEIDFSKSSEESWNITHKEINQFTKLKGNIFLENGYLSMSSTDFAEMYTGHVDFKDYKLTVVMKPITGETHFVNVRVKGAMCSYAAGFKDGRFVIMKNDSGYTTVAGIDFELTKGKEYTITVKVVGDEITAETQGETLTFKDNEAIINGCVGLSTQNTARCLFKKLRVEKV